MHHTYIDKSINYFTNPRLDVISLIKKKSNQKILEIGAGGGDTIVKIKELGLATEVVGVDVTDLKLSNQKNPLIDSFIIADILKDDLPFNKNYFDILIMADVIEHIHEPNLFIKNALKYLNDGGIVIISLPNFREYRNLIQIAIKGDFQYQESGILDVTHAKFYCKKNMLELFRKNNLKVVKSYPNFKLWPSLGKVRLKNLLTLGIFEDLFALQFIFILEKVN